MKRSMILAIVLASIAAPSLLAAEGFRLIANPSVHVTALTRTAASQIFLKKTAKWDDGTPIVAADQIERSPVRAAFTSFVHGKSVAAVKSYWQQQIFSGRDVPPVEKSSDADIITFVRATPGAIGYISDKTPASGLTVIEMN
jgi:ABC-type phosphate transport system substrate-binding protein